MFMELICPMNETVTNDRTIREIADQLQIDNLVYQSIDNLRKSIIIDSPIKDLGELF